MLSKRIIPIQLANAVTLTAVDQTSNVVQVPEGLTDATCTIEYTEAIGENGCYPEVLLEWSRGASGPWNSLCVFDGTAKVITGSRCLVPLYQWIIAPKGASANTPLRVSPIVDIPSLAYVRAKYRETGVIANFGTLSLSIDGTALQGQG